MEIKNVITMLMAQDMDRAVKFYRDALGFSVQFQSPGWTQMTFDNSTVALHGGWTGGRNKTGLGFQVSNIEEACQEAKQAGAEITKAPVDRPGEGIKLAELVDTEGNEIWFSE